MKRKIVPIAYGSVFLGLVFDTLFYGKLPGVSVLLFAGALLSVTYYFARRFRAQLHPAFYPLAVAVLFFAGMVGVRASGALALGNIVLVLYLLLLMVRLCLHPKAPLRGYTLSQYVGEVAELPFRCAGEFLQVMQRTGGDTRTAASRSSLAPVLRGILISLPVLLVFLVLLSSADLVFQKYIGSLFTLNLGPDTIPRLLLIGFITSICIGAYALLFIRTHGTFSPGTPRRMPLGTTEAAIVLGSVGTLFLAFVLVQVAYLFGGSHNVVAGGYTYAEYARKGFFELIAVAMMSLLLIGTIRRATPSVTPRQLRMFQWLNGLLIAEVMVIIGSAHVRLSLYEQAYGFTLQRIFSHAFIGWLAVVFVLLLVHIFRQEAERTFAFRMFISVLVLAATVNIINPEALTARRNISRLESTGKLDTAYLAGLSADTTPELSKLLDHPDKRLHPRIARALGRQQRALAEAGHWQSANLARAQARRLLQTRQSQVDLSEHILDHEEYKAR